MCIESDESDRAIAECDMKAIQAIWKDGRIVPVEPVDWPEGTSLSVEPRAEEPDETLLGNDPESIARWIAYRRSLPPLQMTEAEEADWQASRW